MKCNVVRELLLNYRDGLTSEETSADIRAHLADCGSCRTFYETISPEASEEPAAEEAAVELLKQLKKKIRRNRIIAAISACILLLGLILAAKVYPIPLPFDRNHMSVETFSCVFLPNETWDGEDSLEENLVPEYLDLLDFETTEEVLNGEYDIMESVKLCYQGLNNVISMSSNRTIERDGQEINVVYYCYYMTMWDNIFHNIYAPYSESGFRYALTADQENIRRDIPRMTEVYYLPLRNLSGKLDGLSDEEFDAMREKAALIWSGEAAG